MIKVRAQIDQAVRANGFSSVEERSLDVRWRWPRITVDDLASAKIRSFDPGGLHAERFEQPFAEHLREGFALRLFDDHLEQNVTGARIRHLFTGPPGRP